MPVIEVKNYKSVEIDRTNFEPSTQNDEAMIQDAVLEKVLEANDFEVPQEQIDTEVERMNLEFSQKQKYEALASGSYIDFLQQNRSDQEEIIKREAFKLVKTRMILKGIIEAEHLDVTREELEEEARALSIRQEIPIEMVKDFLGQDLELLKDDLLIRKAIELINTSAIIK